MWLNAPRGREASAWGRAAKQNQSNDMHGCISCEMRLKYTVYTAILVLKCPGDVSPANDKNTWIWNKRHHAQMHTAGMQRDQLWQISLAKRTYCIYLCFLGERSNPRKNTRDCRVDAHIQLHTHTHAQTVAWQANTNSCIQKDSWPSIYSEAAKYEKLISEMPHVIILEIAFQCVTDKDMAPWCEWHIERGCVSLCVFVREHFPVCRHFACEELLTVCGCSCSV